MRGWCDGAATVVGTGLSASSGCMRWSTWTERVCCNTSGRRAGTAGICVVASNPSIHLSIPSRIAPSLILYLLSTKQVTATPNLTRAPIHKSLACPEGRIIFPSFPTSLPYLNSQSSFQESVTIIRTSIHHGRPNPLHYDT
jgi:hypothetical protein